MKKLPARFFSISLTVALIIGCFIVFDLSHALTLLAQTPLSTLGLALTFLLINQILSAVRYHVLLGDFGVQHSFFASLRINALSVLSGTVFFNFFGQSLSRAALLSREDWSPTMAFLITGLERMMSLVLLLLMASAGAVWIFGGVHLRSDTAGTPIVLTIYLSAVIVAVAWLGLRKRERVLLHGVARKNIRSIARGGALTVAMHATMLIAYVVLAVAMAPDGEVVNLFSAGAIVMLTASLPISFAGWGVRELSAAYVFTIINQSPEAGLAMGISVGLLSLLAIASMAVLTQLFKYRRQTQLIYKRVADKRISDNLSLVICWVLPAIAVFLVLFQIRVPTHTGEVNINLADPVVITTALITVLFIFKKNRWLHLWRVPEFGVALAVSTLAISLSFVNGWINYGLIDWALYNRFLGWFLLVSYLFTGTLIVSMAGRDGLTSIFRIYIVSCAAIVIAEPCVRILAPFVGLGFLKWEFAAAYGMVANPTAFVFQLLMAVVIALSGYRFWIGRRGSVIHSMILGILFAGIWFSNSRSGAVALIALVIIFGLLGRLNLRQMGMAVFVAVAIGTTAYWGAAVVPVSSESVGMSLLPTRFSGADDLMDIQTDRALSITKGLELWLAHPIYGAGLGVFIHDQVATTGIPLVIHNSYLWLLAELGVIGFLAFMLMPVSILWAMRQNKLKLAKWPDVTILGFLIVMGVTSLLHDMMYQRVFWILLGAALARPGLKKLI